MSKLQKLPKGQILTKGQKLSKGQKYSKEQKYSSEFIKDLIKVKVKQDMHIRRIEQFIKHLFKFSDCLKYEVYVEVVVYLLKFS